MQTMMDKGGDTLAVRAAPGFSDSLLTRTEPGSPISPLGMVLLCSEEVIQK